MYRHTQIGWLIVVSLGLPSLLLLLTGAALNGAWLPCAVLVVALVLFSVLTVDVNGEGVTASFGPGLIRRRVPFTEIAGCAAVRSPWWYGWGLRIIPGGVMFNVSGLDAVDLTLNDGKHFRIGTDDPRQLLLAVQAGLAARKG